MPAYVIVDIDVHNQEKYPEYLAAITPTVYAAGGKYLARGAASDVISGEWQPKRVVMMEFPTKAIATYWATCEENAPIHAMRNAYAKANMVIIEGSVDFK